MRVDQEKETVLSRLPCPRCGGRALVRGLHRHTGVVVAYLRCPKCRLNSPVGLTTSAAVEAGERIAQLVDEYNSVMDRKRRASIFAEIRDLVRVQAIGELGINGS
jgi:hypothetical protein